MALIPVVRDSTLRLRNIRNSRRKKNTARNNNKRTRHPSLCGSESLAPTSTAAQINTSLYNQRKLQRFKRREQTLFLTAKQSLSRRATRRLPDAHKGSPFGNFSLMSSRVSQGCHTPLVSHKKSIYTSQSLTLIRASKNLGLNPVHNSASRENRARVDSRNSASRLGHSPQKKPLCLPVGVDSWSSRVDSNTGESTPMDLESTPRLCQVCLRARVDSKSAGVDSGPC